VFVKLVSGDANPESPEIHRQEAKILSELPPDAPVAHLLEVYDDGNWVGLVLEDVPGRQPRLPWQAHELNRVLDALDELAARMTPSPVAVPAFADDPLGGGEGFALLDKIGFGQRLDPWVERHLDRLVHLESALADSHGETLAHGDVRADNVLLTDDRVVFVDWPWASRGAEWLDLVLFLPSVAMQGGPAPWEVFGSRRHARPARAEAVTAVVAILAGFLVSRSLEAAPPGLPTLRPFQAAQATHAVAWLRERTGWV